MSTPKPPIPPMYGGPLGSLLSLIQNRERVQKVPADIGATRFNPSRQVAPRQEISYASTQAEIPPEMQEVAPPPMMTPPETPQPPVPRDYNSVYGGQASQPSSPQTSYRQLPDGSMVEIGYNGDPISGYSPYQMDIHNQITGRTPSDSGLRFDETLGRMVSEPNPEYTAEQRIRMMHPSFASYDPSQKIGAFNSMGITPEDLSAMGVSGSDLEWMTQNGYTPMQPMQPMQSPTPTIGYPQEQVNPTPYSDPYIGTPPKEVLPTPITQVIPEPKPQYEMLPSDMDFMRQNGII